MLQETISRLLGGGACGTRPVDGYQDYKTNAEARTNAKNRAAQHTTRNVTPSPQLIKPKRPSLKTNICLIPYYYRHRPFFYK